MFNYVSIHPKGFQDAICVFLPSACCYFLTCFACSIKYVTSVCFLTSDRE